MQTAKITEAAIEAMRQSVREASESYIYWRRQAAVRTNPRGRDTAKALCRAWEYNLRVRQASLDELEPQPA